MFAALKTQANIGGGMLAACVIIFASTDPDIVVAALQTLAAFVKKSVQSNRAMWWHGDAALNTCLFSTSQGLGGGVKRKG